MIVEASFGSSIYEGMKRLRDEVMRKPIGLRLSKNDTDGEESQIHIASLSESGEVNGTVILKPLTPDVVKLRQMSVATDMQGKGLGAQLVRFAESLAQKKGFKTIETHARCSAQGFYEKLGYRATGTIFTEVGLDTIKMHKAL
jgi:predicted N-acetyltransferase YhbS